MAEVVGSSPIVCSIWIQNYSLWVIFLWLEPNCHSTCLWAYLRFESHCLLHFRIQVTRKGDFLYILIYLFYVYTSWWKYCWKKKMSYFRWRVCRDRSRFAILWYALARFRKSEIPDPESDSLSSWATDATNDLEKLWSILSKHLRSDRERDCLYLPSMNSL